MGSVTHDKGNQLDQVYSNLEAVEVLLADTDISDHTFVKCKLKLSKGTGDLDVRCMPVKRTMKALRSEATSEATAQSLL